jgi:hypothetical protein
VAGGEQRRDSPANSNSGSGARFETRLAPTRSARNGEAGRDDKSGGDAAERPDDAAAGQGSSGEVARATGCTGSTTNSMGVLLTSRRSSLAASRRRNDGDGKESKAAAARVCGARASEGGGSGEGVQGAAMALNSPDGLLGVRATCGARARDGLRAGGGGVLVEDDAG